jgi:hypothetical protein
VQTKTTIGAVQVKDEAQGLVSAIIATLGVVDSDQDITYPGAFKGNDLVDVSSYGHQIWTGGVPVGEGSIRETRKEAIVEARFYLETDEGRNTFNLIKARGARQEWSYGYDVLNAPETVTVGGVQARALRKLAVHEVSPVWRGAGVGTRTLSAKARREAAAEERTPVTDYAAAIVRHEAPVSTKAWNFADPGIYLPPEATIDDLRALHAYVDATGSPADVKSYDYPHHHEPGGEANMRACFAGLGRLIGGDHGLSEPETKAVWEHLAGHLEDGDLEPPEMRSESGILKLNAHMAVVLADAATVQSRLWETKQQRTTKGKALGHATVLLIEWWDDVNRGTKALLDSPQEEADREFARYVKSLHIRQPDDDPEGDQ